MLFIHGYYSCFILCSKSSLFDLVGLSFSTSSDHFIVVSTDQTLIKIDFIMPFANDLQGILNKLIPSDEDRQSYTKDADEIRAYILNRMKEIDNDFAKCFDGTRLTGSCLDHIKIEYPDEFDINIELKLPYSIQVVEDKKYPGYLFLLAVNQSYSSKLTDPHRNGGFYISRVKLQNWIRYIINSIFKRRTITRPLSSERSYLIEYQGNTVAHTFTATDQNNKKRKISFDFVPSFEFTSKDWISKRKYIAHKMPWFAVPSPMYTRQYSDQKKKELLNYKKRDPVNSGTICPHPKINHFIFKISAPYQEREMLKNKNNLKNALRLLKAIKDHNDMPKLASYMIKTVFLWEIDKQPNQYWERSMEDLFIEMLQRLIQCICEDDIPFYWNKKSNLLDRLSVDEKNSYMKKLREILWKLKAISRNESDEDIASLFGC